MPCAVLPVLKMMMFDRPGPVPASIWYSTGVTSVGPTQVRTTVWFVTTKLNEVGPSASARPVTGYCAGTAASHSGEPVKHAQETSLTPACCAPAPFPAPTADGESGPREGLTPQLTDTARINRGNTV